MKEIRAVVVEDNSLIRAIMTKALTAQGILAAEAVNADQAWKLIQLHPPHLIVIDIMLPGEMDGIDLCRRARRDRSLADAVIVMVSAADHDRMEPRCREAGADLLIPKPFLPGDFWHEIETIMQRRSRPAHQWRIFVLDDDPIDLNLVRAALAREGYQVEGQTTVTGSIISIKNFRPHLVLLDVMMPEFSGDDLARVIQKHRAISAPPQIVFYSNKSAADLQALVADTGVAGYICKGEGPAALLAAVRKVLGAGTASPSLLAPSARLNPPGKIV